MAGFDAPSLTTTLTSAGWRTELNSNFTNISQAFSDIETILDTIDYTNLATYSSPFVRRLHSSASIAGAISEGQQPFGLIVPFQGLVDAAYVRVSAPAPEDIVVDIQKWETGSSSWVSVLSSPITVPSTAASYNTYSSTGGTDNEVDIGDFCRIFVNELSSGLGASQGTAYNLQAALIVIPRDWDLYA